VTAVLFAIMHLETGRQAGTALVCPDARYASVQWVGADRLDRRLASPALWQGVIVETMPGFDAGPLERGSAIARLLVDRSDLVVQYVWARPLEDVAPASVAAMLDALLLGAR
jgi:hypothetical protein